MHKLFWLELSLNMTKFSKNESQQQNQNTLKKFAQLKIQKQLICTLLSMFFFFSLFINNEQSVLQTNNVWMYVLRKNLSLLILYRYCSGAWWDFFLSNNFVSNRSSKQNRRKKNCFKIIRLYNKMQKNFI